MTGSLPVHVRFAALWLVAFATSMEASEDQPPDVPAERPPENTSILLSLAGSDPNRANGVMSLSFSPDGRELAVGTMRGIVHFYDPLTGQRSAADWDVFPRGGIKGLSIGGIKGLPIGGIDGLCYSRDGRQLAAAAHIHVKIIDPSTRRLLLSLSTPPPPRPQNVSIQDLTYAPDGSLLAAGGYRGQIETWALPRGEIQSVMEGPMIPYSRQIPGKPLRGSPADVMQLAFSPDGKALTSGARDGVIRLWDPKTGAPIGEIPPGGDTSKERYGPALAFSPDGIALAASFRANVRGDWGGEHSIAIWDIKARKPITTLRGHKGAVLGVAFLPGGARLISLGLEDLMARQDRTLRLWDLSSGRQLAVISLAGKVNGRSLALSPDGKLVAVGGCQNVLFGVIELVAIEGDSLRYRHPGEGP